VLDAQTVIVSPELGDTWSGIRFSMGTGAMMGWSWVGGPRTLAAVSIWLLAAFGVRSRCL